MSAILVGYNGHRSLLFYACLAKNKDNANKIIDFAKQENILPALLEKRLNRDLEIELSRKDGDKYKCSNEIIISRLIRERKIKSIKKFSIAICGLVAVAGAITYVVGKKMCVDAPAGYKNVSRLVDIYGMLTHVDSKIPIPTSFQTNVMNTGIYIFLGGILAAIILGIIIYCTKNYLQSAERVRKALNDEQNSQQQQSTALTPEEQEAGEEGKPSSLPGSNVPKIVVTEASTNPLIALLIIVQIS